MTIPIEPYLHFIQFLFKQNYILYRFLRDTVDGWLTERHLLYRMEVPLLRTLQDLIGLISRYMEESPLAYQFQALSFLIVQHESLPLQLLGLANKGTACVNG